MSLLSLFKLEKLTISAHSDASRSDLFPSTFKAMFNPSTYSQKLVTKWEEKEGINTSVPELDYVGGGAGELNLTLLLDDTGADALSYELLGRDSLSTRLNTFFAVAYTYNGTIHEPNYLLVEWGTLSFPCRLSSADIKYTLFDRDGTPLRAEITINLLKDEAAAAVAKDEGKSSPDLTHARIVRHGDTLPLLTKSIYGSSAAYLDVARYNNLDDFRNLIPGQQLLFPPLATFSADSGSNKGS